jgi:hypothetical protein
MSRSLLIVVAGLVIAGAVFGVRSYRRAQMSPFPLWDFRAGTDFKSMDDQASRESKRRYTCASLGIAGAGKLCRLETSGIRGTVLLVLDSLQRAIVIQFRSADGSRTMREEMRKAAAAWSTAVPAGRRRHDDQTANGSPSMATHWLTADGRWSATIGFSAADTLDVVTLRDEGALARIYANAPTVAFAHESEGLVNPLSEAQRQALMARALEIARSSSAANAQQGVRLADDSRRLPECQPAQPDVIVGTGEPAYSGPLSSATMSRAVTLAYPGARLELNGGTYFIDANGRAELARVSQTIVDRESGIAAFGLSFVRRASVASDQIDATGVSTCRAPAQLIVARLDARGNVAAASVIRVAGDATASEIVDIGFLDDLTGSDRRAINVRSSAVYATSRWTGFVHWEELASVDSLRVYERSPVSVGKRETGIGSLGGQVRVENITAESLELMIYGLVEGANTTYVRPIVLPHNGGYVNGWSLLHSL